MKYRISRTPDHPIFHPQFLNPLILVKNPLDFLTILSPIRPFPSNQNQSNLFFGLILSFSRQATASLNPLIPLNPMHLFNCWSAAGRNPIHPQSRRHSQHFGFLWCDAIGDSSSNQLFFTQGRQISSHSNIDLLRF